MKHVRPDPVHPSHIPFEPRIDPPSSPESKRYALAMFATGAAKWQAMTAVERAAAFEQIPAPTSEEVAAYAEQLREHSKALLVRDGKRRRAAAERNLRGLALPLTVEDERLLVDDAEGHDKLAETPVLVEVRTWLVDPAAKPLLIVGGFVGIGKTLAGAWALLQRPGRYVGARELERIAMAHFGELVDDLERMLTSRDLLVLDDLGREDSSARVTTLLIDLVDYRRGAGCKTLVLSNLSEAAFRAHYSDARLLSRLDQSARFFSKRGEDMRKAKS